MSWQPPRPIPGPRRAGQWACQCCCEHSVQPPGQAPAQGLAPPSVSGHHGHCCCRTGKRRPRLGITLYLLALALTRLLCDLGQLTYILSMEMGITVGLLRESQRMADTDASILQGATTPDGLRALMATVVTALRAPFGGPRPALPCPDHPALAHCSSLFPTSRTRGLRAATTEFTPCVLPSLSPTRAQGLPPSVRPLTC